MIGIYKIENLIEHKVYIGATTNWDKRMKKHIWMLEHNQHSNVDLQISWNQYGNQAFSFQMIEECEKSSLTTRERYWTTYYGFPNRNRLYCRENGGRKNKKLCQETKDKISTYNKGKHLSEEHKNKLSDSKKGSKNPMYGKRYTEEEKQYLSEIMKKIPTPEKCLQILKQNNAKRQTPIIQYDLHGNYIQEYPGIQVAARQTNSQASLIHKVLNRKRTQTNGFVWKYKKGESD